jgi:hypothetical protein
MVNPTEPLTAVTQAELVTLALYLAGGASSVVDTEEVAVRVHELAPDRFSWRKYPDQINLELVRVALSDAAKPKLGTLVSGKGRSGWSLSIAGRDWAERHAKRILGSDLSLDRQRRTAGSSDEQRWRRERSRILTTVAWRQWNASPNGSPVTPSAAAELFRVDRYVLGRARALKVNRLRDMFADDKDLAVFLAEAGAALMKED